MPHEEYPYFDPERRGVRLPGEAQENLFAGTLDTNGLLV
jgi:hypothetical protein